MEPNDDRDHPTPYSPGTTVPAPDNRRFFYWAAAVDPS